MTYSETTYVADPNGAAAVSNSGALVPWANLPQNGGTIPANLYVRAIATRTGFVRVYDPTLGGTVTASKVNLPLVSNVIARAQHDDAAPWYSDPNDSNNPKIGMVEVYFTVPSADAVDAASVQTVKVDASAIFIVANGT